MKILIVVASIVLFSCSSETCGKSRNDNCMVSMESFKLLHEGMSIDSAEKILGKANGFLPEDDRPIVGNLGRYYWKRFDNDKIRTNVYIILEIKSRSIVSKELQIEKNSIVKIFR